MTIRFLKKKPSLIRPPRYYAQIFLAHWWSYQRGSTVPLHMQLATKWGTSHIKETGRLLKYKSCCPVEMFWMEYCIPSMIVAEFWGNQTTVPDVKELSVKVYLPLNRSFLYKTFPCTPARIFHALQSLLRSLSARWRQNVCVWQPWQGCYLRVFSWPSLVITVSWSFAN